MQCPVKLIGPSNRSIDFVMDIPVSFLRDDFQRVFCDVLGDSRSLISIDRTERRDRSVRCRQLCRWLRTATTERNSSVVVYITLDPDP
jgi:hypothetical protein